MWKRLRSVALFVCSTSDCPVVTLPKDSDADFYKIIHSLTHQELHIQHPIQTSIKL